MIKTTQKHKWFIVSIFILSFFVRSLVFYFYLKNDNNFWQVDSTTYNSVAIQMSKGNGVSYDKGKPNFYRLPGYSLFLAIIYKIFGQEPRHALWVQIFIASLIPVLMFFLSMALLPGQILVAKMAAIYSCIHLGLVLYSGFLMTESIFIFLFLIFCILLFSSFHLFFCKHEDDENMHSRQDYVISSYYTFLPEPICDNPEFFSFYENTIEHSLSNVGIKLKSVPVDQSLRNIFLAGIFLGLASLVRPVGHYLIFVSILPLLFSSEILRTKIRKGLLLFCGWIIPVSFWLARNFILTGYLFFHTLPGGHFLYLSAARVAMHTHECSYQEARQILRSEVETLSKEISKEKDRELYEIEMCKIHETVATKYFKKQPVIAVKNWLTDIFRTSFSLYSAELLYLDSGRKNIDYFKKGRPISSMFKQYLFPKTNNKFLRFIICTEIFLFLIILIGLLFSFITACYNFFKSIETTSLCVWFKLLPIMILLIVVALSGGYARMRLPVEPFIIILSILFWQRFFQPQKTTVT
jgi:hypothetical protein